MKWFRLTLMVSATLIFGYGQSDRLVDDREITIKSAEDIRAKRKAVIDYIWGSAGFPHGMMPRVTTDVSTPVKELTNLKRVDEFRIDLAPGLEGLAYHFVPKDSNGQLVVLHHGHGCTMDDVAGPEDKGHGLQRTIFGLLKERCGVLGVFMPRMRPGDCGGNHADLFKIETTGSALKFFLEPTAASLNYLKKRSSAAEFPEYKSYHMVGLSGGGWTTTLYAAVDPTIQCSFPVAGTIPLYLRSGGSIGDREQFEQSFYELAGYPDLYILGAYGAGRKQVQILVRRDDCCFGEAQHDAAKTKKPYAEAMREYEARVAETLKKLGAGSFRLQIDESGPAHMISHHAINEFILPVLREKR